MTYATDARDRHYDYGNLTLSPQPWNTTYTGNSQCARVDSAGLSRSAIHKLVLVHVAIRCFYNREYREP